MAAEEDGATGMLLRFQPLTNKRPLELRALEGPGAGGQFSQRQTRPPPRPPPLETGRRTLAVAAHSRFVPTLLQEIHRRMFGIRG